MGNHTQRVVMILNGVRPSNRVSYSARDRENRLDATHIVLVTFSPPISLEKAAALSIFGSSLLPMLNVSPLNRASAIGCALVRLRLLLGLGRPSVPHLVALRIMAKILIV